MGKRWLRLHVLLILIPVGLLVLTTVFLVFERVRGKVSLARYERALAAKGVKLTAKDLMKPLPAGENGAVEVLDASGRLKEGVIMPKRYPPRMKLMPSGRAVVCFRETEWVDEKVTNPWEQLAPELKTNEITLGQIAAALDKPVLNNLLDYSQWPDLGIRHLAPAKALTSWFGAATQLSLHEAKTREALPSLLAEAQLPRLLAEDRVVISELVRIAIAAIARCDVWEALQAEGWTDEDLASVQRAWERQSFIAGMEKSLEGELVFGVSTYEQMRRTNAFAADCLFALEDFSGEERPRLERTVRALPYGDEVVSFVKKRIYCRIWSFAWLDQTERHYLEFMVRLQGINRQAIAEKSYLSTKSALDRLLEEMTPKNLYDRLRFPDTSSQITIGRCLTRAFRAETERSVLLCAIALKRYELHHGKPPATLGSLVPEFISSVPVDYMDGKPLKYHLNPTGAFVLYSVGEDGVDNGGDAALSNANSGVRNVWNRKDFVWPLPATEEERVAYRKEAVKQ